MGWVFLNDTVKPALSNTCVICFTVFSDINCYSHLTIVFSQGKSTPYFSQGTTDYTGFTTLVLLRGSPNLPYFFLCIQYVKQDFGESNVNIHVSVPVLRIKLVTPQLESALGVVPWMVIVLKLLAWVSDFSHMS